MPTPVTMPKLGESVVEGTVARWLKAPGDAVSKLEPLLEINTDKIDTEVPAPAAGMLLNIVVAEGETVEAGTVLAYIGDASEAISADHSSHDESRALVEGASRDRQAVTTGPEAPVDGSRMRSTGRPPKKPEGRVFLSPVVKRMAAEHDVPLEDIEGTGTRGRITKLDVQAYVERQQEASSYASDSPHSTATDREPLTDGARQTRDHTDTDALIEPMSLMRRTIAQHMVASKRTSPHVTTVFEVDMTAVVRHREDQKDSAASRGIRLTYTAYFVAAVAQALRDIPAVNVQYVENEGAPGIRRKNRIHIGVAVALEDGLIVPVIHDADEKSLFGLARHVTELAGDARAGDLAADSTRGGTFTVTNHGVSGSVLGTPIINQPQAGILGIGAIVKRPIVRSATTSLLPSADDAIVIRPMCYLSFSFDHRILDGAQADHFVEKIKDVLEEWPAGSV